MSDQDSTNSLPLSPELFGTAFKAFMETVVQAAAPPANLLYDRIQEHLGADLDPFAIDAPNYEVSRAMQRFVCDGFRRGAIGHELYRRFKNLGLTDVTATPLVGAFTDLALVARL